MKMLAIRHTARKHHYRHQHGVVLIIALIALVALTLSGIALIRGITNTTTIAGNIAFRQSTSNAGDKAIDLAVKNLMQELNVEKLGTDDKPRVYNNYKNDELGSFYFSTLLPNEFTSDHPNACASTGDELCVNRNGIPNLLLPGKRDNKRTPICKSEADATASQSVTDGLHSVYDKDTGNCYSLILERMCSTASAGLASDPSRCSMLPSVDATDGYVRSHKASSDGLEPDAVAVSFRVTARIDGPRGTTSYIQAMLSQADK